MISDALFNDYSLRVKVAVDNYTDVPRAKGSLVEIERVNYVDMSKKLIGKIAKLHAGEEPEVYVPPTKKRASDVGYGQENKMPAFNGGWNQAGGQANGGGASAANAANATCYKCGQTGHFAAACPSGGGGGGGASYNQFNGNGGGGGFNNNAPKKGACHKCGGEGHWARDCPNAAYMGNGNGGNQPVHNGNGYGGPAVAATVAAAAATVAAAAATAAAVGRLRRRWLRRRWFLKSDHEQTHERTNR